MNRRLYVPAAVLAALAVAACVPISSRPLSDPAAARVDRRLEGGWRLISSSGPWVHVYFSRHAANEGMMRVIVMEPRRDGTLTVDSYTGFATHLRGGDFLNISYSEDQGRRRGYVFVRYRVLPDKRLEIALPDESRLKAAVAQGHITGAVEPRASGSEVTLTAKPRELEEFLTSKKGAAVFQAPQMLERLR